MYPTESDIRVVTSSRIEQQIDTYDETSIHHHLVGIGFGPSHLSMSALYETARAGWSTDDLHFFEAKPSFSWHPEMLLDGVRMQVPFLKDLVTPRAPTSPFTFTAYLVSTGRLEQFLNLKTFFPTRMEFGDYLAWAADKLGVYTSYGTTVDRIRPLTDGTGRVLRLAIDVRDVAGGRKTCTADNVSMAPGGSPVLPSAVEKSTIDSGLVIHSSSMLTGISKFHEKGRDRRHRFLVIGAGQSAAEIFQYLASDFPSAEVTLAYRGFSLMPANDSALANEVFHPDAVDLFHESTPNARRSILADLRSTNYAAVDEEDIERIANLIYNQRVRGESRLELKRFLELVSCCLVDGSVEVKLRNLFTGDVETDNFDGVVLATGYDFREARGLLKNLDPYLKRDDSGHLIVRRDYSVETAEGFVPRIYLHGAAEHTHGLTSTLLSTLTHRAGDILDSTFKGSNRFES